MSARPPAGEWLQLLASVDTTTNSFIVITHSRPRKADGLMMAVQGSVEHTQSRKHIYFVEYGRLGEFITVHWETSPQPPF